MFIVHRMRCSHKQCCINFHKFKILQLDGRSSSSKKDLDTISLSQSISFMESWGEVGTSTATTATTCRNENWNLSHTGILCVWVSLRRRLRNNAWAPFTFTTTTSQIAVQETAACNNMCHSRELCTIKTFYSLKYFKKKTKEFLMWNAQVELHISDIKSHFSFVISLPIKLFHYFMKMECSTRKKFIKYFDNYIYSHYLTCMFNLDKTRLNLMEFHMQMTPLVIEILTH